MAGLRTVHSHVHALGQCRGVIRELGLTPVVSGDTAGAAREVAEAADPTQAAIAPPLAAEIYGLEVLRDEIEDEEHNTTRFIVLSRDYERGRRAAPGRSSRRFIFNVRNLPAALYKALGGFATNGVNMTKLESYMVGGALHRDPVPRRGRRPPRRPGRAQRARGAGVLHHRGQGARRLPGRRLPGRVGVSGRAPGRPPQPRGPGWDGASVARVSETPGPDERTADLGFARVDLERAARTGDPEVVYGAGKTPEQVASILTTLHAHHPERAVLATRLSPEAMDAARDAGATVHETARAATLGPLPETTRGRVGVVSAGTSDAPVAAEVALTVACHGAEAVEIRDVGVAGLHRLMAVRDRLDEVRLPRRRRRHGGRPAVRGRRPHRHAAHRGPDQRRVRRVLRRPGRPAGHAQLLRARRHRGQHRQRVRRRRRRRAHRPPGGRTRRDGSTAVRP